MGKRRRLKGAKPDADDAAFAELQARVRGLAEHIADASGLMDAITAAVQNAVQPYQAHLAQLEKDALVEAHPGWDTADVHHFPGVLT